MESKAEFLAPGGMSREKKVEKQRNWEWSEQCGEKRVKIEVQYIAHYFA